jgi:probable phosphoglycerate mutase
VGKTVQQIESEASQMLTAQVDSGWDFCPPGGESRKSVLKRSQKALIEAAGRYRGDNLLVVTHEGVVKSLIYHLCGRKFLPGEPAILKPYQLHWLIHDQDGFRVEELNAMAMD